MNSPTRIITISIGVTVVLLSLKIVFGLISHSIAVLSDALDSADDLLAGLAVLLSVRIAAHPPDAEHPYGHGKVEGISAIVTAGVIAVGGGIVIWLALRRILLGSPDINVGIGLIPMLVAIVTNSVLSFAMRRVARRSGSLALASEATHLQTNVVQAGSVIIGLTLVSLTGAKIFDPLVALGLAGYMWWTAAGLIRNGVNEVMDASLPQSEQRLIHECIAQHAGRVRGFHHFRSRKSGSSCYVEFHLLFDPAESIRSTHEITDSLEAAIKERMPRAVVTIHAEPDDGRYRGDLDVFRREASS